MQWRRGFTLVEITITIALLTVLIIVAGSAMVSTMRLAAREQALLQMDQDANRMLETIKHTLRPSYIPFSLHPLNAGRSAFIEATNFEDNVERWRSVLQNGTDLLVFLHGVDPNGSGDIIYGNSQDSRRIILGIHTSEHSAAVPNGIWEATDESDNLNNLGIIDLNPLTHLMLPDNNSAPLNMSAPRFAPNFVFPSPGGGRKQVYGVIRFKPIRENGAVVVLKEADLGRDLNNDGDSTDEFVLGHMEIVYPTSTGGIYVHPLSSDSMLLQRNRDDSPQDSVFQLWTKSGGGVSLKIHVLLCNFTGQQSPLAFRQGGNQLITRSYETLINMPLMTIR